MSTSKTPFVAATALTGSLLLATALWTQSRLGASLLPHAFCITASPSLLWLHVVSDGLIALAYLLIPLALLTFIRGRPDVPFGWLAWLFGAFILACGATHAMHVWTLWEPVYWYSGVMKAFTAAVSLATAWVLFKLVPRALAIPSAGQLRLANTALEREIASRRQAETALMAAQAELQALLGTTRKQAQQASAVLDHFFDAAPLGLAVLDPDFRFVRVNAGLPEATGRPAREYQDGHMGALSHMPPEALAAVERVARTGERETGLEISGSLGDGAMRHWLADFFPIALPDGTRLYGCVVQDISYQRRVERQREEALAAAEEANRAKDQFLARVSHELRSPLQVALSSAELLKRLPDMPAPARKCVDRMGHAIRQQARMVSDLVDLSRILSGKLHMENEAVDPSLPLLRIVDHWTSTARTGGVEVDCSGLHAGDGLVLADPGRLEQVYTNLLDNAVRFSEPGGRVVVGTQRTDSHWRLSVQDFGAGLSASDVLLVFEPFVQGDVQPRSGKGLGLGLAIVKSSVEAFGGRVWAESAGLGQGSTFVVELPLLSGEPGSAPAPLASAAPRLDRLRILYVEDEVEVAVAMQEALRQLGASVEVATSCAEAVAKLGALRLDVVVTDLNLGSGPDGRAVAQALHGLPQHRGVPVIAVSAFGSRDDLAQTRRQGFAAHLVKPISVIEVAEALNRVTNAK